MMKRILASLFLMIFCATAGAQQITRIPQLPASSAVHGTDLTIVDQVDATSATGYTTRNATISQLSTGIFSSNVTPGSTTTYTIGTQSDIFANIYSLQGTFANVGWVAAISPFNLYNVFPGSVIGISNTSYSNPVGVSGFAKASDNISSMNVTTTGGTFWSMCDKAGTWACDSAYFEVRQFAGNTGFVFGFEADTTILTGSDSPATDPFNVLPTAMSSGIWLAAGGSCAATISCPGPGGGAGLTPHNVSQAIGITNNGAYYRAGIMFNATALVGATGQDGGATTAAAMMMGRGQGLYWYTSDSTSRFSIGMTAQTTARVSSLIYANAGLTYTVSSATNPVVLGVRTDATTYNAVSLNGVVNPATMIGLSGGGGSDGSLYVSVPTGGAVNFLVNGASVSVANAGGLTSTNFVATAVAQTVSAGQIAYGSTVVAAGSGNCPTGAVGTKTVAGCIVVNVAGTGQVFPYF